MARKKTKVVAAVIATIMALTIAGCSENTSEPKDTPNRIGKNGTISGEWAHKYTLDEVIEQADIIVDLTITEWLGESTKDENYRIGEKTYFSAKINQTFKGEQHDTIVLQQSGNREWTWKEDPLYHNDERLLLFLKAIPYEEFRKKVEAGEDAEQYDVEYENAFYSIGSVQSAFNIWEYEKETFLLSRFDFGVADSIFEDDSFNTVDDKKSSAVVGQYREFDPVLSKFDNALGHVFKYEDVAGKVERFSKLEVTQ